MRIVGISDIHGYLPPIPECDLLLIAGDVCPVEDHTYFFQRQWLDTNFRAWLESVSAKDIVGIAGNHDFIFDPDQSRMSLILGGDIRYPVPVDLPWTYLHDSGTNINGINIWGTPWQPWFGGWAFNASDPQMDAASKLVPEETDIWLVHGPPAGYGDRCADGDRAGSFAVYQTIRRIEPKLVVSGHIHENPGRWHLEGNKRDTLIMNASYVDLGYTPQFDTRELVVDL